MSREDYLKRREAQLKYKADKLRNRTPEQIELDRIKSKEYRIANKERIREAQKKYYNDNKETLLQDAQEYRDSHRKQISERNLKKYKSDKQKILTKNRNYYYKNKDRVKAQRDQYRSENLAQHNHRSALRHAVKLKATPKWLTEEDILNIKAVYKKAKELQELDGIPREVDHIVPLQGETVSGLHVPWNLQILTKSENSSKKNKLLEEIACQVH
jgi:hypothetical protein